MTVSERVVERWFTMQGVERNGSGSKYGPGNTVVGEPVFPDDAPFPSEPAPSTAPSTHPMPAPPAGTPIEPTQAAEATTGEALGFGYGPGYGPNVSTPYPAAPVAAFSYPSTPPAMGAYPPAPAPLAGYVPPHPTPAAFPVPPPPPVVRARKVETGPSLLTVGAISFVVIGGLTTAGFLVARSASSDDANDKPIVVVTTGPTAPATVPIEEPSASATAREPATAKPVVHRPINTSHPKAIWTARPRPGMPTPTPPTPTPTRATPAPAPTPAPTATQPDPTPPAPTATEPSPANSGRHPRNNPAPN